MLQVKLPYYPQTPVTVTKTPFGVQEISQPEIYRCPLSNRVIVCVDTLDCLRDKLGDECFICRELLYAMLSGKADPCSYSDLFACFYRRYPAVRSYVNEQNTFGDPTLPLLDRCIQPLREEVNNYAQSVISELVNHGAKFLVSTHDYVYVAFNTGTVIPTIKGAITIC